MAQNHQTNNPLYKALEKKYIADIAAANATMIVYFDKKMDQLIKNDINVTPIIFSKKGSGMLRGLQLNENVTAGDFGNIAREKGLLLVGAAENTIRLLPPLNTSKEEVDNAFDILDDIVLELKKT